MSAHVDSRATTTNRYHTRALLDPTGDTADGAIDTAIVDLSYALVKGRYHAMRRPLVTQCLDQTGQFRKCLELLLLHQCF